MITARIFNGSDSVDITLSKTEYEKLRNFIHRQEGMEIYIIS